MKEFLLNVLCFAVVFTLSKRLDAYLARRKRRKLTFKDFGSLPTPRNLDEAVEHALCIGPLSEVRERSYHVLKDYLAQSFGIAYMNAGDDAKTLKILEDLFAKLTKRGN